MSTTAHISYDQYSQIVDSGTWENRRLELVHGEIHEMSPIGPSHQNAVDYLNKWSFQSLNLDEVRIRIQGSIGLPELESCPEPDVVWVTERSYREERPQADDVLLLIEVADSSLRYDLGKKANLYAAAGILDYWVVDLEHQKVEVFREPTIEGYQSREAFGVGSSVPSLHFSEVELATQALFEA